MKTAKIFLLAMIFFMPYGLTNAQIVINEYSCANLKNDTDNFGKHEDWIELYNAGTSSVNLTGYYISDRTTKPTKWQIPFVGGTVIPAKGFFIVWASNRDTCFSGYFHTNFALKQTKSPAEKIVLSNPSGQIIDSITITVNQLGHSTGRTTDGGSTWSAFTTPSPKASNNTSTSYRYAIKPVFTVAPGFYTSSFQVLILTTEPNSTIRYTLNGKEPTSTSPVYSTPLTISTTTVLKAKVFSSTPNVLPSLMEYGTYFMNINHTLPVVSITGDSVTLLADGNENIKPFGTIEYYGTDKLLKSKSTGEFNSHGKDSWVCDQRSLDFIARDEMGDNYALRVNYISSSDRSEYQRVLLRASGDDNYPCGHQPSNEGSAHMRDGYIHNLAKRGDLHLDVRTCERMVMYINGKYWGVYEIRENPDDHDYTKYYYNQDKYNIQYIMTWGWTWAEYGGDKALTDWQALYNFIMTHSMAISANYEYVDSLFNIKSFVDYIIVNSFTVCSDWLVWNTGWWRGLNPKGDHKKWGYILWDNDATFAFYINYTGIPDTSATADPCNVTTQTYMYDDPEGHLKILNRLNQNPTFHQYYVNRQTDLLNTAFSCDTMLNYLDQYTATIDPEMTQHAARWGGTYTEWKQNVARMRYFVERRCAALETGIRDCYNLTGPYDLTLNATPAGAGKIKLNTVEISNFPWTGRYYGGINTTLEAIAIDTANTTFNTWSSGNHTFSPSVTNIDVVVSLTTIDTIVAHFITQNSVNDLTQNDMNVSVYPTVITYETTIDYDLREPALVNVELYDLSGKRITQLIPPTDYSVPGQYKVKLDFSKANLNSGTYLLSFSAGSYNKLFKIVYLH